MHPKTGFAALICAAALAAPAFALTVDTGAGPSSGGLSLYDDRPVTKSFQSLAARFTVAGTDGDVHSVEGWMNWPYGGGLILSIREDFRGLPGALRYKVTIAPHPTALNQADWRGASGLDWTLGAGDYWLVFEDAADKLGSGGMPTPVASPLAAYAAANELTGFFRADTLAFGVRINYVSPVPEPASASLMMLGGLLLIARARRPRA